MDGRKTARGQERGCEVTGRCDVEHDMSRCRAGGTWDGLYKTKPQGLTGKDWQQASRGSRGGSLLRLKVRSHVDGQASVERGKVVEGM